ncbi:uncharacterized protein LOC112499675 [Cynara cardunculus var. scolymus]|uniref:LRAT-like domain-containing protein n=1 Tax=Cynara cardunculus var. scolymus TaxID=59895 RepID=A0A103XJB5_CYNCS|nr:uncharacterized protein LOC112499675 [Cynara cardunculus var. scolymus]KVH91759.1 hypothetical protein Ccrd_006208 [Cynara cardunculus var. scolymus]
MKYVMKHETVSKSQLKAGDHVFAPCLTSEGDNGIFIGGDRVIYVVERKEGGGCFGARWCAPFMSTTSSGGGDSEKKKKTHCEKSYCGEEKVARSGVRLCCVDCFINEEGFLHRFICESDAPKQVVERATYLYENGCSEHKGTNVGTNYGFVEYCKTGYAAPDSATIKKNRESARKMFK